MGDDSDWLKLPTEEKCQHKAWKARVAGYEELIKLFQTLTDEKSPEFSKYLGLVKKFVIDSNVVAQEKGLEATLVFVENSFHAGKTAGEVSSGIIAKCLNQKPKIRDLGVAILMAFIEAEKQEIVQEELMKGLSNKQPKVVSACVVALREALRDFGTKIISIKPILGHLQALLEDRDKTVRDETKLLVIEIYRWIGKALRPQLSNLKPVQMSELDAEFEKLPESKPQQTRFLRSQQDLKAKMMEKAAAGADAASEGAVGSEAVVHEEVDAYDLLDPVDLLSKLPKDFYDKVEEKKWQERKEALEAVQKLAESPKLEQGDYNDLVRALKKVVAKDTNVMLVAIAAKCIALIATGLRKKFATHAAGCVETLIEKFKEKKAAVVQALKEAIDACFVTSNLEAISEICIAALDHKTPSVRAETAAFLARCFSRCTPVTLPKKLLNPFVAALLKTASDTTAEVREASFEALGTAMKVIPEKAIMPLLSEIDALKMAKIKECCEKAKGKPEKANATGGGDGPKQAAAVAAKPGSAVAKPGGVPSSAKGPAKKGAKKKGTAGKGKNEVKEEVIERELSDEAVDEKMAAMFPGDTIPGLSSANWKERLSSMERLGEHLKTLAKDDIPVQAFVRTVVKKPGLKDNNFQVLKLKVDFISCLGQRGNFSKRSADYCLADLVDKIGDAKNGTGVQECLSNIAEATALDYVAPQVLSVAFEQKNPKNQSEALNWLSTAIKQFGLKLNVKSLIDTISKALASANPAVRTSGIALLSTIYIYMGESLKKFFENEKPALLQQINAELDKVKDEKPPAPTRGLKPSAGCDDGGDEDGKVADENDGGSFNPADLIPRTDISDKITDALLTELEDKNWKVRKEALEKFQAIVSDAKFITANIGSLPEALKPRLADSNKILGAMTIALCHQLTTSMGPQIRNHIRAIIPGLFSNFGDSKPNIRQSAVAAVNVIMEQVGPASMGLFVEGEVLFDALKNENPTLRAELLGWLAGKLQTCKKIPSSELIECVPILYSCLEDRNADVRKKAGEAVMPFMMHCGHDAMLQKVSLVKPVSKDVVMKALDQAKQNLPAKPSKSASAVHAAAPSVNSSSVPKAAPAAAKPSSAKSPAAEVTDDVVETTASSNTSNGSGGGVSKTKIGKVAVPGTAQKKGVTSALTSAASKKKQVEEEDTSPPMKISNAKDQRIKDEKNLKVLKWNFDTPRKEFIDQLKSQMESNFNKTIMEQLFHADFKFQIKAMDTLIKVCEEGTESTKCNLDLILKWLTLRFFDTNTTVLLKALEYLLYVFKLLAAENYHISEMEASSFVPYLVNKVGDPKDNIRRDIRTIIQLLAEVYSAPRIAGFLMEGLKSKNAKQRTECLEELGSMIQFYGMAMCQPSLPVALKLIAQQIGDRDNSVRSAALNTIVAAYEKVGESIFKNIGNLSEKDMSMLEERIKRSAKGRPAEADVNQSMQVPPPVHRQKQNSPDEKPRQSKLPGTSAMAFKAPEQPRQPVKGPFQLEFDDQSDSEETFVPKLIEPDLKDIDEPITLPVTRHQPRSPSTNKTQNVTMDRLIAQVSSVDINNSICALHQIEQMLKDGKKTTALQTQNEIEDFVSALEKSAALKGYVNKLLVACSQQLRFSLDQHMQQQTSHRDVFRLYKSLISTILSLCKCKNITSEVSKDVAKDLIENLITILLDSRLAEIKDGSDICHAVNVVVVKIVENMEANSLINALIDLLHETIDKGRSPQFLELVMKCLWKMTRMIPTIINQLNLDQVIGDIHSFYKDYPAASWRSKTSDMPMRTLKTILHNLTINKGDKILNHLTLVDGEGTSEVEQYIRRVLRSVTNNSEANENNLSDSISRGVSGTATSGGRSDQEVVQKSHRISRSIQDSLAEIFKKIGCKETTNEGLNNLYDFKVKHPDADLEPFLKKSSPFFQDYISQGLKNIETQRQHNKAPSNDISQTGYGTKSQFSNNSAHNSSSSLVQQQSSIGALNNQMTRLPPADPDLTAEQYLERLKFLRERCGLDNSNFTVNITKPSTSSISSLESPSPGIGRFSSNDDVTLSNNAIPSPFSISARNNAKGKGDETNEEQFNSSSTNGTQQPAARPPSNYDELKKRLERIKNSGRE